MSRFRARGKRRRKRGKEALDLMLEDERDRFGLGVSWFLFFLVILSDGFNFFVHGSQPADGKCVHGAAER